MYSDNVMELSRETAGLIELEHSLGNVEARHPGARRDAHRDTFDMRRSPKIGRSR